MLFNHVRRLCSEDKTDEELTLVERFSRDYGYPMKFMTMYGKTKTKGIKYAVVKKKLVLLKLGFKGD